MRRGSELKKASRREPSVWMHSLISKKNRTEERGGNGGQNTGQLPPLPQADLWVHTCTSACSVIYIMRKCFCCPRLRYQRGKTEPKWLQGGRNAVNTTDNCPPGRLKEEQVCSRRLATQKLKQPQSLPRCRRLHPFKTPLVCLSELNDSRFPLKFTMISASMAVSAPLSRLAC